MRRQLWILDLGHKNKHKSKHDKILRTNGLCVPARESVSLFSKIIERDGIRGRLRGVEVTQRRNLALVFSTS